MSAQANAKPFLFSTVLLALANEPRRGLPWWAWLLIIILVILIILVLWWWLGHVRKEKALKSTPSLAASQPQTRQPEGIGEVAPAEPSTPAKPDDLTIIEGIGPKIASVLQAAGISTFAQLAEADLGHLNQILQNAGLRLANAETWPEQARLAAEGKWDELEALKASLKGGRRV